MRQQGKWSRQHLHSTMLLLYPIQMSADHLPAPTFTFHYASTISPISSVTDRSVKNLHSTMLLLYRRKEVDKHDERHKFTFHYASTISWLCYNLLTGFCGFTFHYASTISGKSIHVRTSVSKFTFHYASTISRSSCHSCAIFPDLHSTMLLLYHNIQIYIER